MPRESTTADGWKRVGPVERKCAPRTVTKQRAKQLRFRGRGDGVGHSYSLSRTELAG